MSNFSDRLAELLVHYRGWLFGSAVVLLAAAWWPANHLQFDRTIENTFPADSPLLASYRRAKDVFGGSEIILAVYEDKNLFAADGAGLRRARELRERLEKLPGIDSVLSIDRPLDNLLVRADPALAGRLRELFSGYTHSRDGRTVALACILVPREQATVGRREITAAMRHLLTHDMPAGLAPGMVAGEPVMVADGYRFIEEDGRRLFWATSLLLAVVIYLCFRSVRWVVVPILIVQAALLGTRAMLGLMQLRLSMVSSMLDAVVTVVGIATVVHIIVRFRELRTEKLAPSAALRQSLALLLAPVFWAIATDAAGFGALMVTRVGPVQDFGLMMAIGACLVMVSVCLLLPAAVLTGRYADDPHRAWGEHRLEIELDRLIHWVERRPWLVGGAGLLLTVFCGAGAYRLEVESDFTKNFRSDSEIARSYAYVEEHLGGAGVWDVIIPAPPQPDYDFLRRVRRLETRLQTEVVIVEPDGTRRPGLTKSLSLADAVAAADPQLVEEIVVTQPLPLLTLEQTRQLQATAKNARIAAATSLMQVQMPSFYRALYSAESQAPDRYWLRIMLRSLERQSAAAKKQIIADVQRIAAEEFPSADDPRGRSPEATGFFVLLAYLVDSTLADQWKAFLVASTAIGLMMLVALRNVSYSLIALVTNMLPIFIITGAMGWLGLKINMGAAMIAAVSMGLSIDSSIHYILSFQRALATGASVHDALGIVQQSVGRAMIFSTLALIAGFGVLCFSEFVPTIYFGVLVSLTMLGALAGNLLLLPLALKLVTKQR